ncbi:MAG: DUF4345 family protein [Pseudohongiella sp.]|nr:DUF4345 family protein [Pseudohongiella sp.]MDP2127121.1 DUF4345 family protein [Pseudohongiella sp.]
MTGKIILWVSALVFIAYGLVSLIAPAVPAGFAGLIISNGNAYAEISSMYGGLQTGIGLFCLLAAIRPEYYRGGLALLTIGIGALTIARFIGFVVTPDSVTAYTYGALVYEFLTATLGAIAWRQAAQQHQTS